MPHRHLRAALALAALALPSSAQLNTVEEAVLKAVPAAQAFGWTVDAHGDVVVGGAPFEDEGALSEAGVAYVFRFDGTAWSQVQRLLAPVPADDAHFGYEVAVHGDLLAVTQASTSPSVLDEVHVFRDVGGTWTHEQTLQQLVPSWSDEFGDSLAMDGERLVVGAPREDLPGPGEGAAYVFRRDGNTFVEEARLQESHAGGGQFFGIQVALDDDTGRLVVGAASYLPAGVAYVYHRTGTSWSQAAKLEIATFAYLAFGSAAAIDGDTVLIGAPSQDTAQGIDSGAVHVYEFDGATWQNTAQIDPPETTSRFGSDIALAGDVFTAGESALVDEDVFTYGRQGGSFAFLDVFRGPFANGGGFTEVDWSDGRLFVGAVGPSTEGIHVFTLQPDPPVDYCTAGTSASGCVPALTSTGQASASAPSGFDLVVTGVEGSKRGLFYWSPNGRQAAPWGSSSSYQCVVPPVSRGELLQENGTTGLCDGSYTYDLNARWTAKPWQNPGVGAVVGAQFWYRDPFSQTNLGTSISGALEFTTTP